MVNILVFGDSFTFGAWDTQGGWVQRLRRFLDTKTLEDEGKKCPMTYNLGVSGNTTELLLKRFEFELKQRLDRDKTIVMIQIGENDSATLEETEDYWVSPDEFKENLKEIVKISKKYCSEVVFLGLSPVDEDKVSPFHGGIDLYYKNKDIRKYNEIIRSVCEDERVYFIDLFEEWRKSDYEKLLEDGVHPNKAGHVKIYETVRDFLLENEVIEV